MAMRKQHSNDRDPDRCWRCAPWRRPCGHKARPGAESPAGRGCNLPEPFPCPVARILELTVDPSTINPGESAHITWSAENPTNITLSPGVGRVEARGTLRVSPVRDDDVYPADRGRAERGGRHPLGDARRAGDPTRRRCRDNGTASHTSHA